MKALYGRRDIGLLRITITRGAVGIGVRISVITAGLITVTVTPATAIKAAIGMAAHFVITAKRIISVVPLFPICIPPA